MFFVIHKPLVFKLERKKSAITVGGKIQ